MQTPSYPGEILWSDRFVTEKASKSANTWGFINAGILTLIGLYLMFTTDNLPEKPALYYWIGGYIATVIVGAMLPHYLGKKIAVQLVQLRPGECRLEVDDPEVAGLSLRSPFSWALYKTIYAQKYGVKTYRLFLWINSAQGDCVLVEFIRPIDHLPDALPLEEMRAPDETLFYFKNTGRAHLDELVSWLEQAGKPRA